MKISLRLFTLLLCAFAPPDLRAQIASTPPPVAEKTLADVLGPTLAQARTRTVRILMGGTSIATFGYSNNQLFASHLKALYGDALADVQRMGSINGSWDLPTAGWIKQPYSGPSFTRLRGDTSSSPLVLSGYGSQVVVEYSCEVDGGLAEVTVENFGDGGVAQKLAFDCAGSQKFSQQAIYRGAEGALRVTIAPPKSGYAYIERVTFGQQRPGIEVIDGTLGGSNLGNIYTVRPAPAQGVVGIPTQSGVGIDSYFGRRDVDIVIYSGPVNDAGHFFPEWAARMNDVVEVTRPKNASILSTAVGNPTVITTNAPHGLKTGDVVKIAGVIGAKPAINGSRTVTVLNPTTFTLPIAVTTAGRGGLTAKAGRPLLLVAEMGGHFSMPTSPQNGAFLQKHDYLKKLGRENAHVYTLDWHGATADSDIVRYAANYYTSGAPVVINPATGNFTGDFIHPNQKANQIALRILCDSLKTPTPPETFALNLDNRIRKTSPLPAGTPISFVDGTVTRTGVTSELAAAVYASRKCAAILPLVFSPETTNLTDLDQQILASPTSDRFGKYIDYPSDHGVSIFGRVPIGERVTLTALIKPISAGQVIQFRSPTNSPGIMHYKNSLMGQCTTNLYDPAETPLWVTFDYVRGAHASLLVTGRLYSISVTRTNGVPVSTRPRPTLVGPELLTSGASGVASYEATINARVRSAGSGILSVAFDLGTTPGGLNSADSQNAIVADSSAFAEVSLKVTGLTPDTVYYYRVRATTAGSPTVYTGETASFRTPPAGGL